MTTLALPANSHALPAPRAPADTTRGEAEDGPVLLASLLEEQSATAVERFAEFHESAESDGTPRNRMYRDLVPLDRPREGEQYAFEVDLDQCSGCKACVAACHNLNGLEPSETWRDVGLLVGGTDEAPAMQHVTTACHHCVEPACLTGCPVKAYEKDPETGIVRHLDDQCIGCQYCIFKCPYDVPVYSPSKGIVRKCDMCHDRLAAGEAPACVQSCPNEAIRIRVVDRDAAVQAAEGNNFLPGAPDPGYTLPTTVYKSRQGLARNLLPADYYAARTQHAHWPLIWMLVLTQMSVGAFVVELMLWGFSNTSAQAAAVGNRTGHLLSALSLGLLGLFAAVFHLGRPQYAFRAVLGLRTSWLSREILAFGLYAFLAAAYVGVAFLQGAAPARLPSGADGATYSVERVLGLLAAATGVIAVLSSVMVYVDTHRPFWGPTATTLKFLLTALLLGLPLALAIGVWTSWLADGHLADAARVSQLMRTTGHTLCGLLIVATMAKLCVEAAPLVHLRSRHSTPLKRAAWLLLGELGRVTLLRCLFGLIGGVLLPWILLAESAVAPQAGYSPLFVSLVVLISLGTLLVGEVLERYLFFTASVAPKMPGGPAA